MGYFSKSADTNYLTADTAIPRNTTQDRRSSTPKNRGWREWVSDSCSPAGKVWPAVQELWWSSERNLEEFWQSPTWTHPLAGRTIAGIM